MSDSYVLESQFRSRGGERLVISPSGADPDSVIVVFSGRDPAAIENVLAFLRDEYNAEFTTPVPDVEDGWIVVGRVRER